MCDEQKRARYEVLPVSVTGRTSVHVRAWLFYVFGWRNYFKIAVKEKRVSGMDVIMMHSGCDQPPQISFVDQQHGVEKLRERSKTHPGFPPPVPVCQICCALLTLRDVKQCDWIGGRMCLNRRPL